MNGITRYCIGVSDGTRSWMVLRRYTEFAELHNALHYAMPGLPPLPPKSFWRKTFSNAFKDERQAKLCGLLQAMVTKDPQLTIFQLRQFLEVPNAATAVPPPMGATQSQAMYTQALQQPSAPPPVPAAPAAVQQAQPVYSQPAPAPVPVAQPIYA